jgi:hypothetical protein
MAHLVTNKAGKDWYYNVDVPVGHRQANRLDDVLLVQALLNCLTPVVEMNGLGGRKPVARCIFFLDVDGVVGPLTSCVVTLFTQSLQQTVGYFPQHRIDPMRFWEDGMNVHQLNLLARKADEAKYLAIKDGKLGAGQPVPAPLTTALKKAPRVLT